MTKNIDVGQALDDEDNPVLIQGKRRDLLKHPDVKALQKQWHSSRLVLEFLHRCQADFGADLQSALMVVQSMWGKGASALAPKDRSAKLERGFQVMREDGVRCHIKIALLFEAARIEAMMGSQGTCAEEPTAASSSSNSGAQSSGQQRE